MHFSGMEDIKHDLYHLDKYQEFCELYGITDLVQFVKLYDIYELVAFMPPNPTASEKAAFQQLVGTTTESGYMDYQRTNNTFELLMQWVEATGNFHLYQQGFFGAQND
jgi:hypothetical protein